MNHKHRWKQLRPLTRHWIINVLIGLAIEGFLLGAHYFHASWLESSQNVALDMMMRGKAAMVNDDRGKVPPLAFIDVDTRTWRAPEWGGGEPYRPPRDRLLELIAYAFDQGARQVVLDILLEGRPDDPADMDFAKKLGEMVAAPNFADGRKLILARSIRSSSPDGEGPDELRTSALDPLVDHHGDRLELAAPYFKLSSDLILRDWQLWSLACRRNGPNKDQMVVVPSVQLLVAAHARNLDVTNAYWRTATAPCVAEEGNESHGGHVQANPLDKAVWQWLVKSFDIRDGHESLDEHSLGNRIVFNFAGPLNPPGKVLAISALDVVTERHGSDPQTRASLKPGGPRLLKDAIVVIGQSFPEAHDRHATPLDNRDAGKPGSMAGSLVLLNSIDSMLRHGFLHPPGGVLMFCVASLLIVVIGYVFARWDSVRGTLIALVLVLGILAWASYYLFKFGVWLDFAVPLVGIQLHRVIKSYEEYIEHKKLAKALGGHGHGE